MTMEQKRPAVNTRRRYDSSGRRERARQTRDQITGAAQHLFLTDGYAATTVTAVGAWFDLASEVMTVNVAAENDIYGCAKNNS